MYILIRVAKKIYIPFYKYDAKEYGIWHSQSLYERGVQKDKKNKVMYY